MRSLRFLTAALASVAVVFQPTLAHSRARNPVTYVTLIDDPIVHTNSHRINAFSKFEITFLLHDGRQKIRLALEPNHDVFHDSMTITHLNPDGSIRSVEPVDRASHNVFKGKAYIQRPGQSEWSHGGWARITIHRDGQKPIFEGAFKIDGDHHHIHTGANYQKLKHVADPHVGAGNGEDKMVVWRDSDVMEDHNEPGELRKREPYGRGSCGSQELHYNSKFTPLGLRDMSPLQVASPRQLFGRDDIDDLTGNGGAGVNLVSNIGSTAGCPTTRKVALIGVAADCTYRGDFDSEEDTRKNIIQQVHAASAVYEETFDISLGIQNLTIVNEKCPSTPSQATPWNVDCNSGVDISDRLSLFSEWRGRSVDTNAYWMLLSKCNTGSAVGLAWLGQICHQGSQTNPIQGGGNETIASANVVVRTGTEWQVIAHETGHTFGAVHDCTDSACSANEASMQKCCPLSADQCDAGAQFIMNPSTGRGITNFSPCSIGNICAAVGRTANECLLNNKNVPVLTEAQCGNGIVEEGEDCDCGGEQSCGDNQCCDPGTCKFKSGAVCDPANEECCTDSCQFASAGTICRNSTGFCDPEEKCSGTDPVCPDDKHLDDGTTCGDDGAGLQCASGQCTSRNQQCQAMMGSLGRSSTSSPGTAKACENQGCQLACQSTTFRPDSCILLNQNFLDGTPCQGGGKCSNGRCEGASIGNEIKDWITENKQIVIPVASVLGGIIFIAILSCCYGSIKKRMRSKRRKAKAAKSTSPMNSWARYGGSFAANGGVVQGNNQSRRNIPRGPESTPPRTNAPTGPPPPPSYSPYRPYQPQWGSQGQSMRYA